jgi:hypothetical protein
MIYAPVSGTLAPAYTAVAFLRSAIKVKFSGISLRQNRWSKAKKDAGTENISDGLRIGQ